MSRQEKAYIAWSVVLAALIAVLISLIYLAKNRPDVLVSLFAR